MRNTKAKFLRATVLDEMYGEVSKEDARDIFKSAKFKAIYRRRKKNATYVPQKPNLKFSRRQQRQQKTV